ncbi:MAG: galactokinase [Chloroflexi bacterium]|nr:MAG: galactokinase [Chloroflexota bacterium]
MAQIQELLTLLNASTPPEGLVDLYGNKPDVLKAQKDRYCGLIQRFQAAYPGDRDAAFFSSPGRTEVGGNHTDHNAGRVLAAAVNLDILSLVEKTGDNSIIIDSEGYRSIKVDINKLEVIEQEKYSPAALVRGVCARLKDLGYTIGGFQGCMTSSVPNGSGLSSSAAFELMVVSILNDLYNQGKIQPVLAAQIGQFAENEYFGKPCGLMDQTTCAVGGFVTIDFKDFANPVVHKVDYQFAESEFSLAIIGSGGSHADLNEDYAAIENEMKSVARALGGKVLREFSAEKVLENAASLRGKVNDRAILRALHFYADDDRVVEQVAALESSAFDRFLALVIESGYSSWMLCQNVFSPKNPGEQGIAVALAVSDAMLKGRGAWRVHGGGFAGTIQAFVPAELVPQYMEKMSSIFGKENCHLVSIRSKGATRVALG